VALRSFPEGVRLIAGGRGKGQDFSPLAAPVAERTRAVYLIGEAGDQIAAALRGTGVPVHACGNLEAAVAAAMSEAVSEETVLLSPACASYDQFGDFEVRGARFRELVLSRRT
jgi:UDP-N-acetylmuramoylalanine--D-glutamate ligase